MIAKGVRRFLGRVPGCLLLGVVVTHCALGQVTNQRIIAADGREQLLGALTQEALSAPPFSDWYLRGVAAYQPDEQVINNIDSLQDYEIQVFMGTWCSDSQREVPRLVKTLNELGFPGAQLSIVGVNRATDQYKQSPNGEEIGKNIHRVPTIIFYRNGEEVNRVIERPVVSMEQDIRSITSGEGYTPNYVVVEELQRLLNENGPTKLLDDSGGVAELLKPLSIKPSELAIYGAVQLSHGGVDAAVSILEINRQLFPDQASVYADLAAAYLEQGAHDKAKANAEKALSLEPGNDVAIRILAGLASQP